MVKHLLNIGFLFQKQYIFLYRALLDISIFGDTEIQYKGLSTSIENLKKEGNNSKGQCKLEIEYEVSLIITPLNDKHVTIFTPNHRESSKPLMILRKRVP